MQLVFTGPLRKRVDSQAGWYGLTYDRTWFVYLYESGGAFVVTDEKMAIKCLKRKKVANAK